MSSSWFKEAILAWESEDESKIKIHWRNSWPVNYVPDAAPKKEGGPPTSFGYSGVWCKISSSTMSGPGSSASSIKSSSGSDWDKSSGKSSDKLDPLGGNLTQVYAATSAGSAEGELSYFCEMLAPVGQIYIGNLASGYWLVIDEHRRLGLVWLKDAGEDNTSRQELVFDLRDKNITMVSLLGPNPEATYKRFLDAFSKGLKKRKVHFHKVFIDEAGKIKTRAKENHDLKKGAAGLRH
ncbi:hypothetical protein B0T24DRAFT_669686 [Lasiosphaeria ovina]|uniref:Uncharacterized protein n=1 Tax=Lasiosphaeria ovina TaxID=92902 RepID=A0AAE0JZT2_9PEZI|nr:hypothetical protein B0T24DRAFT_669686 [Lasiosphaeria ovina]